MFFGSKHEKYGDPDDFFSDTRMSFGDHIEELRTHLIRAILGFCVAVVFSFFIGKPVLHFIAKPVEEQLGEFYERREKELKRKELENISSEESANQWELGTLELHRKDLESLGIALKPTGPVISEDGDWVTVRTRRHRAEEVKRFSDIYQKLGPQPVLKTLNVQEAFMVYFKVCMVTGFVLASPWVFYQIWAFVAAGLYPHEKKLVNVFLPFSLGLFFAGVALCEWMVLPNAVNTLLWFNEWLGLEPDLRLNEWLGFAIILPVIFGIAFQTPLVMFFLERIGVASVEFYRSKRRMSWFVMAVLSALGPTTDPYSMLLMWVPMCLFYEMGIWMCLIWPRNPTPDIDVPESEEMIEV